MREEGQRQGVVRWRWIWPRDVRLTGVVPSAASAVSAYGRKKDSSRLLVLLCLLCLLLFLSSFLRLVLFLFSRILGFGHGALLLIKCLTYGNALSILPAVFTVIQHHVE